jgi:hypothetical protein
MYLILFTLIITNYVVYGFQRPDDKSPIPIPRTMIEKMMQAYGGALYVLIAMGKRRQSMVVDRSNGM